MILDATYQPAQQRHAVRALADGLAATLMVFKCKVLAEEAVCRFKRRNGHAATDLSAERVRDLAQEFPYFEGSTLLDTSQCRPAEVVESVIKRFDGGIATPNIDQWISQGFTRAPGTEEQRTTSEKLTSKSRRRAKRAWVCGRLSFYLSVVFARACPNRTFSSKDSRSKPI